MKKVLLVIWLSLIVQCQSQKTKNMIPVIDNKQEKFDIEYFNKMLNNKESSVIINNIDSDEQIQKQSYGYISRKFYSNSSFVYIRKFYSNYSIKEKGLLFNEGSQIGVWYYFDESGKLLKEKNTDTGYDFSPKDIVKYCEKNKINLPKGYHDSGFQTQVLKEEMHGKKVWRISYQIAGDKIEEIILDGKTGKELQKKIVPFHNS